MQINRDITATVIFFSIMVTSTLSFKIKVFNKEKKANEDRDLFEYIKDGKMKMLENSRNCSIAKKAIMVLGLTGTGKSTLINYLNDVPLVGIEIRGSWRVTPKDPGVTLPCGFEIGHNKRSETHLPSAFTPPGSDFSYLDNPGFGDTKGIEIEVANAFFRKEIAQSIDEFKFLLLITSKDLYERGQQFRDSMERFSEFLEIFDSENAAVLSKSIGIIVARVENNKKSDAKLKELFCYELLDILNDESEQKESRLRNCGINEKCRHQIMNRDLVFRRVIENSQVEIFSAPESNATLDGKQKLQIIKMIDKLEYIKKNDVNGNKGLGFRVVVEKGKFQELHVRN